MAHSHSHTGANHGADQSPGHERRLLAVLVLTGAFVAVELAAAWWTGSLALLSDAAHMMTDAAALAIAIAAIRIGRRPADRKRTFGYYRFEILAAAANALLLIAVAAYIGWEAWQRLHAPADIPALPMLAVAVAGLVVNLVGLRMLREASSESLNMKGAYLEVWSDLIGSAGVILAAGVIAATGWGWVDSLVAVAIAVWILPRTWLLLKESMNVLLQGVPADVDFDALEAALRGFDGVREVHALHVWSITSGRNVMSAHLVVDPSALADEKFIGRICRELEEHFGLSHTTIQLESAAADRPHPSQPAA